MNLSKLKAVQNHKFFLIMIVLLIVVTGLTIVSYQKTPLITIDHTHSSPHARTPKKQTPHSTEIKVSSDIWKAALANPGEFRISDFDGYLKSNHSPQSSAAVFDLTQDLQFLLNTLEEWPDSVPLLKRVALFSDDEKIAGKALDRLRVVDQTNSLAFYMSAALAVKAKKFDDVIAYLQHGLALKAPNFETTDDIISRKSALLSIGMQRVKADLKSLLPDNRIKSFLRIKEIANYYSQPENSSKLASDPAGLDSIIGVLAHLRQTRDGGAFPKLDVANEVEFLQMLSPEDIVGDETAGERIIALTEQSKEAQQIFSKYSDVFPRLSEAELSLYADKVLADGEWAAVKEVALRAIEGQ